MTNKKISHFLYEIYEMLDIKGDDRFRINSYRNASRVVDNLSFDIDDLYQEKGIPGIDGIRVIGQSIATKIAEFIETGKCKYYDDLAKDVPKSELELMRIPGIGPRTAKKLYERLRIRNLSQLELAAKSGKLRCLDGFDVKTEEKILRNLQRIKKIEKRLSLDFAQRLSQDVIDYLKDNCPAVEKINIVGSLRRQRDTIGDIDIVVASRKPQAVIECFANFPKVKEILSLGRTKAAILHEEDNTQIDLEVLRPEIYGSLLQHLTGSKDHNIALRTLAKKKGFSLSEYGILDIKKRKRYNFKDEKSFYKKLGLSYIEPELRENRGEIEAAAKDQLPELIKESDIRGAVHMHSTWSEGNMDLDALTQFAISKRYNYIVVCDHSSGLGITYGVDNQKLLKQIKVIDQLNSKLIKSKFKILKGVEVNIKADGSLDISDKVLEKLDVVIASVHSAFDQNEKKMTERLLRAIYNPHVDIIGHPTGRLFFERPSYDAEWPEIFKACNETGTILEINAGPRRLDLLDNLVFDARRYGIKFVIGLDVHDMDNFDFLKYGIGVARRAWLTKKDVLNTLSVSNFLKSLK